MAFRFGICGAIALCLYSATASAMSFEAFMAKHGKSYANGTREYAQRLSLFEKRLADVTRHNSNTNRRWNAVMNKLSDWTEDELQNLRGWNGNVRPHHTSSRGVQPHRRTFLQRSGEEVTMKELPEEKSWAGLVTSQHIHNQGGCGSCWAISAATVLEGHTEIHGHRRSFAPQQIVSCTPNPRSCGGTGKCEGATAELAMDYVLKHGCAEASAVPYTGTSSECTAPPENPVLMMNQLIGESGAGDAMVGGAAFGMTGWEMLPKNEQEPLMRALVDKGPVAVSVAATDWNSYDSGVFDGCDKDAIIDHSVVLIAYGKDAGGAKFWQIQNSWGADWGEAGRIRLLRHDDGAAYCGIDSKPQLGTACKGEDDPVPVCGMCGVLFDSVVPHFS